LFEVGSMQVESTGKTEYVTTFDDEGRSTSRGGGVVVALLGREGKFVGGNKAGKLDTVSQRDVAGMEREEQRLSYLEG
jgi:hypothetical protein